MRAQVCVIDSGVALDGVASHHEVMPDFSVVQRECGEDSIGHGTAVAGIIQRHAPEADIHSMKVIGRSPFGDHSDNLLAALEFVLDQSDWEILNISVSIPRPDPRLIQLIDALIADGRTIVSAVDNDPNKIAWPAAFPNVLAVEHDFFEDPLDFRFDLEDSSKIYAHGIYVEAPTPDGRRHFYTGASFAAPHVTALFATRILASTPNVIDFPQ